MLLSSSFVYCLRSLGDLQNKEISLSRALSVTPAPPPSLLLSRSHSVPLFVCCSVSLCLVLLFPLDTFSMQGQSHLGSRRICLSCLICCSGSPHGRDRFCADLAQMVWHVWLGPGRCKDKYVNKPMLTL